MQPGVAALAMTVFLSYANPALACSCVRQLDLGRRVAYADLVLVAKVSSFKPLEHVKVSPLEVFKGSASKTLTIRSGHSDCDFFLPPVNPKIGEEYLLFLRKSEGALTASRCLEPALAAEKASDLGELRKDLRWLLEHRVRIQSPALELGWHEGLVNRTRREPPCYVVITWKPRVSPESAMLQELIIKLDAVSELQAYSGERTPLTTWAGLQSRDLRNDALWRPIPESTLSRNRDCASMKR